MKTHGILKYTAILLAACLTQAIAAEPEMVWVSSLDLSPIIQGWGKPQADKSVTGTPMAIAGRKFEHGLGTHANSLARIWPAVAASALTRCPRSAAGQRRGKMVAGSFKILIYGMDK